MTVREGNRRPGWSRQQHSPAYMWARFAVGIGWTKYVREMGLEAKLTKQLLSALADAGGKPNLTLNWLMYPVWGYSRQGFFSDSPTISQDSNPSNGENHKICGVFLECMYWDWESSVADICALDSMPRCTEGTWKPDYLGQQMTSSALSEDGMQNRLHYSHGQVLQHIPGAADIPKWTRSTNQFCKYFLNSGVMRLITSQHYQKPLL